MKTKTIIQLNFLVLGLALTIYCAYQVKKNGLNPGVRLLLGLQPDTNQVQKSENLMLNWCDTRVTGLIFPDEFKVTQEGREWVAEASSKQTLNFLEMEKWLAENCRVPAQPMVGSDIDQFLPRMIVKFVNGKIEVLKANQDGHLLWKGRAYSSPVLISALEKLRDLTSEK